MRDRVGDVFARIEAETGIKRSEIVSPCRCQHIVRARHAVMAELRAMGLSLCVVARLTGRTCHTTVINGIRKHRDREAAA